MEIKMIKMPMTKDDKRAVVTNQDHTHPLQAHISEVIEVEANKVKVVFNLYRIYPLTGLWSSGIHHF